MPSLLMPTRALTTHLCFLCFVLDSLSLWNTMMGTSVLAMPWAIAQAGFAMGLVCIVFMCALALYTCQIVLSSGQGGRSECSTPVVGKQTNQCWDTARVTVLLSHTLTHTHSPISLATPPPSSPLLLLLLLACVCSEWHRC